MTQQKILKIKVGEVWDGVKTIPVFQTFFPKISKKGETYYQATTQAFIHIIEKKEDVKPAKEL
jgi:hypothetical protein